MTKKGGGDEGVSEFLSENFSVTGSLLMYNTKNLHLKSYCYFFFVNRYQILLLCYCSLINIFGSVTNLGVGDSILGLIV